MAFKRYWHYFVSLVEESRSLERYGETVFAIPTVPGVRNKTQLLVLPVPRTLRIDRLGIFL